ncbi:MAG: hypothetical protein CVV35_01980 [Methanomicrobiales archaeon HGW-Methanomicrobiales-6]|jgi:hypothetical protein|nr:MAG: hypothetical protein CVV35_01980 [Methanomicrobiales archaeon HGW-Methanomicrobiales-6]
MVQVEVRRLYADELPAWDELVAASPQGTIFHSSDWLVRTASSLNRTPMILGCYEDGDLIGGCPLLLSNPYGLLRTASSAALLAPYGGVVTSGIESTKRRERELHANKIIASVCSRIARMRFAHVELVHSPWFEDIRWFTRNGWDAKVYYTYVLPTDGDVFSRISKNARRSINRAEKQGITTEKQFDAGAYWMLTVNTFERQNSRPPFTKKHLFDMLDAIREKSLGEMWVARTSSGEIAAAEVVVYDSKMVHRWSAASAEEHLSTGAASLLLGEVIAHFAERNYPSINLMAGNMANLSAFIATFNPDLVPYYGVESSGIRYGILRSVNKRMRGMASRAARPAPL